MESSYAKNNGSERNILDQMTEGKQLSFYKVCDVCENFLEVLLERKKNPFKGKGESQERAKSGWLKATALENVIGISFLVMGKNNFYPKKKLIFRGRRKS